MDFILKGVRHGQARHHTPERRLERQGNDLARRIGQKSRTAIG